MRKDIVPYLLGYDKIKAPDGINKDDYIFLLEIGRRLNIMRNAPTMRLMWGKTSGGGTYEISNPKESLSMEESKKLVEIVLDGDCSFPIELREGEDESYGICIKKGKANERCYHVWKVGDVIYPGAPAEITHLLKISPFQISERYRTRFEEHINSEKNKGLLSFIESNTCCK